MNKDFLLGLDPRLQGAMEEFISLYNTDTMRWFAHLWDPVNGAFYYSNSGRDYEGFGPDLESTMQTLRVVANRGMVDKLGGIAKAMPPEIIDKIIAFADSLLAEDGYFYHPQWGRNIPLTRRGRDLNWGCSIYDMFGRKPPRSTAKDMLEHKNKHAQSLLPEHLLSKKAFYSYLDKLDIQKNSYAVGNNINSQITQIKAAGLEKELCIWLDSKQNPQNGLWQDGINYDTISGLMKLSAAYVFAHRKMNYMDKVTDSIFEALTSKITPTQLVYIYNPISALSQAIGLLKNTGDTYEAARLKDRLMENAPAIIENTSEKVKLFRKPDGSFSYTHKYSAHRSQNMPVALFEECEGDVNATSIVASGVFNGLFYNLDIPFKIFDEYDFKEFISIMKAQKPIVKKPCPEGRFV